MAYGREAYDDYLRNYEGADELNHYRTLEERIDEMDTFGQLDDEFDEDEIEMLTWEE